MSRAFIKEQDGDSAPVLPDRPLSPHRNLVTAAGLAQIETEIARLRAGLVEATGVGATSPIAAITRDLRYCERDDGRRHTYRIVGEDEADPKRGTVSYVAPLARALTGKVTGDEFEFMGGTLAVISVDHDP